MRVQTDKKANAVDIAITQLKQHLRESFVAVMDRQYNILSVVAKCDGELAEETLSACRKAIAGALEVDDVTLKTSELADDEAKKYLSESESGEDDSKDDEIDVSFIEEKTDERIIDHIDEAEEWLRQKADELNMLRDEANALIGANEFKELVESQTRIADYYTDRDTLKKVLCGMSYLLSVNKGGGRTTVSKLFGEILANLMGYRKRIIIKELELVDQMKPDGSNEMDSVIRDISSVSDGRMLNVFVLHMDGMQNKLNGTAWVSLLEAVSKNHENKLYIFAVPYLEDITLEDIHRKINDGIANKIVKIPPFTNDMYVEAFSRFFGEYGMTLQEDAYNALFKKIAEEKSDGSFHGLNTVKKIVSEVLYYKAQNPKSQPGTVTAGDIELLLEDSPSDGLSGFDRLNALVSLDEVKEKVREILATIKLKRSMGDTSGLSMHMMFSGAPGTGKTVVARLIGQIFKEEKVLTKGDFYEVTRKDLVGSYVGHTAPKTAEVCRAAYGSVLFIDEAYSLAGGGNDFGKEAISTLIAEMENNRDNMVVVFAGYENDLQKLFDLNPGLRDRIPYRINFDNYSREELAQIFYMNISSRFTFDDEFRASADEFFANLSDEVLKDENFSNGRYVRNLVERIFSKSALRVMMDSDSPKGALTKSDFMAAVGDSDFSQLNQKTFVKKRIGF